MAVDLGTASTLTGGSSGAFSQMTDVQWSGISREPIRTSAMDTSAWHTFVPADLQDPGELQVERLSDGTDSLLGAAAAETWTLLFGGNTSASAACSGFVTSEEWGVPFEDNITQRITIKLSGAIS